MLPIILDRVGLVLSRVAHRIGRERRDEFVARGFRPGSVFPHTLRFLPKAGPDGYKIAERMLGRVDPDELWEIVLYADPSLVAEFPADVFFDDDLVWHQQQLGLPGQVATANVVLRGNRAGRWCTSPTSSSASVDGGN